MFEYSKIRKRTSTIACALSVPLSLATTPASAQETVGKIGLAAP
jgi:hypothetical protein